MKNLIAAALLLTLSQVSFAFDLMKVECDSPELNYINKLELSGFILVSGKGNYNSFAIVDMNTTDAGNNQSPVEYKNVFLDGETTYFPNQELNPFWKVSLVDQESTEIIQVNLLVNHPTPLGSFVRFANGKVFKGNCTLK